MDKDASTSWLRISRDKLPSAAPHKARHVHIGKTRVPWTRAAPRRLHSSRRALATNEIRSLSTNCTNCVISGPNPVCIRLNSGTPCGLRSPHPLHRTHHGRDVHLLLSAAYGPLVALYRNSPRSTARCRCNETSIRPRICIRQPVVSRAARGRTRGLQSRPSGSEDVGCTVVRSWAVRRPQCRLPSGAA